MEFGRRRRIYRQCRKPVTVDVNAGTLHLYGLNQVEGVEAGHLDLQGAGSRFTLHSGAILSVGGLYLTKTFKTPDFGSLVNRVGTPNAIRAGQAVDRLMTTGDAIGLGDLYGALINLEDDALVAANALAQLHGEVFASDRLRGLAAESLGSLDRHLAGQGSHRPRLLRL